MSSLESVSLWGERGCMQDGEVGFEVCPSLPPVSVSRCEAMLVCCLRDEERETTLWCRMDGDTSYQTDGGKSSTSLFNLLCVCSSAPLYAPVDFLTLFLSFPSVLHLSVLTSLQHKLSVTRCSKPNHPFNRIVLPLKIAVLASPLLLCTSSCWIWIRASAAVTLPSLSCAPLLLYSLSLYFALVFTYIECPTCWWTIHPVSPPLLTDSVAL